MTTLPVLADEAGLLTALGELRAHVEGTAPLTDTQIASHKQTIDANAGIFGDSAAAISASFGLVNAYDTHLGPMWMTGSAQPNGFDRRTVPDNIHWTVYNVMQNIIDNTYNPTTLAAHGPLLDGLRFGSADVFPGHVAPPADPTATYSVSIDASFLDTFGRDTQHWTWDARKSTGAALAPGAIATITVPQSIVGSGIKVRVGGHSWDMEAQNRPFVDRWDRSTILYDIDSTEIQIASPFGGNIYFDVPFTVDQGVFDAQITGAVRAPFFSMQDHHTTTLQQWLDVERHNPAPWADFQSEKFMMHVPTEWVYNLEDPVTLMQDWDKAMDIMNDLMGFPRDRGKETMFPMVDVRLRSSVHAPGYPSVNVTYDPERSYGGYHNHHLVRGPQTAGYVEFHEQGHAYFFPKFAGETEALVNLLHVAVKNIGFGADWDNAFADSLGHAGNPHRTIDNTAVAWMTSFNFSTRHVEMHKLEKQYQLKGHAKYVEVARLFGWDALGDFWHSLNQDEENGLPGLNDDQKLVRMSQMAGANIAPIFHFWGVFPNDFDQVQADMDAAGVRHDQSVLDLLNHYKTLVPEDNAAFQQFALNWWGRVPNPDGYWTESEHGRQFDENEYFEQNNNTAQRPNGEVYDENAAAQTLDYIDEIIRLYFPTPFVNIPTGDLNFDEDVTAADWLIFREAMQTDLSTMTQAHAYLMGDLDLDGDNDIYDFDLFRRAFEQYNPDPGAFEAMLIATSTPEPGTLAMLGVGGLLAMRRRPA